MWKEDMFELRHLILWDEGPPREPLQRIAEYSA